MIEFPQYRKLTNNRSYYRIEDETHFMEIQLIGSRLISFNIHASQYPEIIKIKDMLTCQEPYLMSDSVEFDHYSDKLNM